MNESGEHEAAAIATGGTEPPAPESHVEPAAESAATPTSEERAVASPPAASAKFELPPLRPPPRRDPAPLEAREADTTAAARQWEDATPTRARGGAVPEPMPAWSASEVTVVTAPVAPDAPDLPPPRLPPVYSDEDTKTETSGTVSVPDDHRRPQKQQLRRAMAATRTGIELGRPLFAIALVGAIIALGSVLLGGVQIGQGALTGAVAATLNFWGFTRIGTAMLSRHGVRAPWGLLAALKLVALFGGVLVILRMHLAEPIAFLIGYLALPVGIVGSQLLGLQPDFDEGEGS